MKIRCGIILSLGIFLSGCNFFGGLDTPSGDAQILSAARACFDAGDYTCAANYYSQLSTQSDQTIAESILDQLAKNGATASVFINTILGSAGGNNAGGKIITNLAGTMTATASETTRLNVFRAYKRNTEMGTGDLKSLIRFLTSLTLVSELLAETAATRGTLEVTDIAKNATCATLTTGDPAIATDCAAPTGSVLIKSSSISALPSATELQMSGAPTLYMVDSAINEMASAASSLSSGSSLNSFGTSSDLGTAVLDASEAGYRWGLVRLGIGSH